MVRILRTTSAFRNILNFLETRIRLEVLTIIRRFRLKGDALFEIRQKTTASAYAKLQKEIIVQQQYLGDRKVYLFEILFDLVGVRLICMHDEIQKRLFDFVLQVESLAIQSDGLEYYSAPFRDYTLAKDIHEELANSISRMNQSISSQRVLEKKSKLSNYESLHFYVKFASKVDSFLLLDLTKGKHWASKGERVRDAAESEYLLGLYDGFSDIERELVGKIPIEFQIRTITDHLWAQEEHKYVYKNATLSNSGHELKQTREILKSTFTGLKFAYYNVERLRSLVRRITQKQELPPPSYTGSSKDIDPIRFKYFGDISDMTSTKFKEAEVIFFANGNDFSNEQVISSILSLFDYVSEISADHRPRSASPIDVEAWGRKRLFYLFLAFTALFSRTKTLPIQTATQLDEKIDLVDIVGDAAFKASVNDKVGCLKLASKIYERIETFDRIARSLLGAENGSSIHDESVFLDPLVGIRLASSFFLQSEFAGARKALHDMFKIGTEEDQVSWHKIELAKAFALSEILMRQAQYIMFECFEDEDKLINSFQDLITVFDSLFELKIDEFCSERYRSYCWYYSLINYLFTQEALVPQRLLDKKENCRSYLLNNLDIARENEIFKKPEVQLAMIYLPVHYPNAVDRKNEIEENHRVFEAAIANHKSYPRLANIYLVSMARNLRQRAVEKSSRTPNVTFMSYSRENKDLAHKVVVGLRALDVSVVYDEDFENGEGISEQVERAMSNATTAILLLTPDYLTSRWGSEERSFLMDKRRRQELRLFVLNNGVGQDVLVSKAPLLSNLLHYSALPKSFADSIKKLAKEIKSTSERL